MPQACAPIEHEVFQSTPLSIERSDASRNWDGMSSTVSIHAPLHREERHSASTVWSFWLGFNPRPSP